MEIVQLVYHSVPVAGISGTERLKAFRAIHKTSVERNRKSDIGGFLIFTGAHFIQLLEGERQAVMATYERIRIDARHSHPVVVDILPCRARAFGEWSMGASHDEIAIREAMLNAGIGDDQALHQLGAKQIMAVLAGLAVASRKKAA